ncbi:hypothetical protein [Colwellia sp. TT2012]|uniref:hypothetical protein n=1 Tax=Colwellia sp. TT2012 TaxID=1720342 RepID=UPI001E2A853D|nr:hypothetical protein [Colwellia sp. TT2012]
MILPFLQTVFCLKGFDDRSRFFASSMFALLGFIFFSAIFSSNLLVSIALLFILTAVLTCSTKRRLYDATLNKNWQLVPGGLLLLTGVLSLIIENSSSYYLLILPALSCALLLTYPSTNKKVKHDYILGYYGPVDLGTYQQKSVGITTLHQRIEPTLVADSASEQVFLSETVAAEQNNTPNYQPNDETARKQADLGELIRLKMLSNRKLQLGVIASVALIFIAVFVSSVLNSINQQHLTSRNTTLNEAKEITKNTSDNIIITKKHLLAMPDNFNLYLSEYQGIIIHWQADQVPDGELWSLLSAQGDKSCQSIKFNKGEPLRPLTVLVENGSEYFASFSPLDSRELVQALAFRGKFSLCGYSFSLNGSQAVLGKNLQYAPFLDKDA